MSLTKEEYIDIIENLDFFYGDNLIPTAELRKKKSKEIQEKDLENFKQKINCLKQLINERFELVELLKKHDLENLSIKELDKWFDRSLWHVNKVNELSNQLVEYQRVAKQKQERIEELEKQKTKVIANININREELEKIVNENIHKLLDNTPLKFEELKEKMWVWDNKTKSYIFIFKPLNWEPIKGIRYANMIINHSAEGYYMNFEENRFYTREVKEDVHK